MNPPSFTELTNQTPPASTPTQPVLGETRSFPPAAIGTPAVSGETDSGSDFPAAESQVLRLNCPKCRHPLNLRREHLGVEGHCVECGDPLVAVEKPGAGVVVETPGRQQAASREPLTRPEPSPPLAGPIPHPVSGSFPAPAQSEQTDPPPARPPSDGWTSPDPVNSSEISEFAASMAGFTGSSGGNQTPESTFANDAVKPASPESLPAQVPESDDAAAGDKSPWSPFANPSNPSPLSPDPQSLPEATIAPSPEKDEPSKQAGIPFASGFASLFNQSDSGADNSKTGLNEASETTKAGNPAGQQVQSPLPWESKSNSDSPMSFPANPQSKDDVEPQKIQWNSPLNARPNTAAETAPAAPPETRTEASPSERESGSAAEDSNPVTAEPDKKKKWGRKAKKTEPVALPGSAMGDFGRRRTLGRPRRGFGRFLIKLVVTFVLVVGIVGGTYLFTPPEKIESWKADLMEFLKPGAVLKDHLPFKVPFLEKLAEEEVRKVEPAREKNNPASQSLPSAEIRRGPAPQAAIPVSPKKLPSDRRDEFGPGLATVGKIAVSQFYQGQSIEERAKMLVDPKGSLPEMRAFYQRYQSLPTLRSIAYRGPVRDAASGRWFAVLDVRENENEEVHRWAVTFTGTEKFRVDWSLYQQLRDDTLSRFLTDPAAPPKTLRLLVRRGEIVPEKANPWSSPAVELLLQTPLDNGRSPERIVLRQSDFDRLGLASQLRGSHSKIAKLKLAWTDSDSKPVRRVATIQEVFGWGAW